MTSPLIEVQGLSVRYGKVEALHEVSLTVESGQIVAVIGPNGAGKTTLLGAMMGLLPSTGEIRILGDVIRQPSVEEMVGHGVGLVPEKRELFGEMTVLDNLILGAFARYRSGDRNYSGTLEEVFKIFPRLQERQGQLASTLSGGERQMLAIGRALMAKPRLLMLDEPSLGLAPLVVKEVLRVVASLRDLGVSILLVEQNARAALRMADWAYVLEMGEVAMHGPAKTLAGDARIIETYLGLSKK